MDTRNLQEEVWNSIKIFEVYIKMSPPYTFIITSF